MHWHCYGGQHRTENIYGFTLQSGNSTKYPIEHLQDTLSVSPHLVSQKTPKLTKISLQTSALLVLLLKEDLNDRRLLQNRMRLGSGIRQNFHYSSNYELQLHVINLEM